MPLFFYRSLYGFFDLLIANSGPKQITLGIWWAMALSFCGIDTVQWWAFFTGFLFFRLNILSFLLATPCLLLLKLLLRKPLQLIGSWFLTHLGEPIWSLLYHAPFFPFTRFYSNQELGSLIFVFGSFPLLCLGVPWIILRINSFVYHTWRSTQFYNLYLQYKPYARD